MKNYAEPGGNNLFEFETRRKRRPIVIHYFFTINLKLDFSFRCIFDLIKMNPVVKAKWRRTQSYASVVVVL